MTYGSVCSGIEAATVAWEPLGWKPLWFAEVDKFCNALLAHRYPKVKNYGDFTRIGPDTGTIDLLCGGTPCQDFSVAGLRAGLDGERGNLTLEFVKLADRLRPRWLVWENVPGILSVDGGRAFGALLGGLEKLGYGFAYRVLDAQYFGVPQRRRRVFVVGYLGDWRRPAAVLFERHCLSGYPAPSREARQGSPTGIEIGPAGGRFTDLSCTLDARCKDGAIRNQIGMLAFGGNNTNGPIDVATACNAHGGSMRMDFETETFCVEVASALLAKANCSHDESLETYVAHTLRGEGMDASEDGAGRGTPLIPVAFSAKDYGAVRRLTPKETERLQGFPDDYTLIPYRGKPAADGPRYKAIGNSMAVPVMRWIGERIEAVERMAQ